MRSNFNFIQFIFILKNNTTFNQYSVRKLNSLYHHQYIIICYFMRISEVIDVDTHYVLNLYQEGTDTRVQPKGNNGVTVQYNHQPMEGK